jgi:hypothetical protein
MQRLVDSTFILPLLHLHPDQYELTIYAEVHRLNPSTGPACSRDLYIGWLTPSSSFLKKGSNRKVVDSTFILTCKH